MTQILRYIAPNTEKINGSYREEHHFYLSSDHDEAQEIMPWIFANCVPHTYTFWHELIAGEGPAGWSQATQVFHVSFQEDRDAKLFRLRW